MVWDFIAGCNRCGILPHHVVLYFVFMGFRLASLVHADLSFGLRPRESLASIFLHEPESTFSTAGFIEEGSVTYFSREFKGPCGSFATFLLTMFNPDWVDVAINRGPMMAVCTVYLSRIAPSYLH